VKVASSAARPVVAVSRCVVGGEEDEVPRIELPELADGDLRLRLPAPEDVGAITASCQDPEIQRWTRVPSPYREEDARGYVEFARTSLERGTGVILLAVPIGPDGTPGGKVLGAIGLSLDRADFSGELGYWVAPDARRRGVAVRGCRRLCRFGFEELGLGYVALLAAVGNEGSNAVARRLGFSHEGTLRAAMIDGPSGDRSAPRCDANWWGIRPGELT
jgi:RimJ/RimL family protein N-acetyltransferase